MWHAGSPCSICGGSGQISMLSSISFALILFVGFISTFLGFFGFGYYTLLRQLKRNPWVKDVEKMGFWFDQRPQVRFTRGIYWTWLFYHDRNKWAKLTTIGISAGAIFFVSFFGMIFAFAPWASVPPEDFWTGWVVATIFMVFFAIIWYLNYKSAD